MRAGHAEGLAYVVTARLLVCCRNPSWLRMTVLAVVSNGLFGLVITLAIVVNTVTLSLDHYGMSP